MKYLTAISLILLLGLANSNAADFDGHRCSAPLGITLQVLGSGGPIADDSRASTAYLVWIDGRSRFMIDTGGGAFLRFGEAGARFEDLTHIGISHFHTDHSTDLSALLKSGYFSNREDSLSISGPSHGGLYPGMDEYLERLLGPETGAYEYLAGYLQGRDGLIKLDSVNIDASLETSSQVYNDPEGDIEISALGVPHGPVPALAYKIRIGQKSLVFSGDQNGSSEAFLDFASGTDVLVMHMPVPENISGTGRKLHAPPSIIGNIAAKTGASTLVLSHFMARSLENLEGNLVQVRNRYKGSLVVADDLDCIGV